MKDNFTTQILITIIFVFFVSGFGYIIFSTQKSINEFRKHCIDSGMQYISQSCVK